MNLETELYPKRTKDQQRAGTLEGLEDRLKYIQFNQTYTCRDK